MGVWRRQEGQPQQQQKKKDGDCWGPPGKNNRRSYARPPRAPHGKWIPQQVPEWERNFLEENRVSWRKVIETQKVMHLYKNVANWDDSGAEESFKYAKSRYETKAVYRLVLPLPNPDLYIDSVDHDSILDLTLLDDLYNNEITWSDQEEKSSQETGFCWGSFDVNLDEIIPTGWENNDDMVVKSNDIDVRGVIPTGWDGNDRFSYCNDSPGIIPSGREGMEAVNGRWDKIRNNAGKGGNNRKDGNDRVIVPDSFWDKWVDQYNQPSVPDNFWDYWADGNNKRNKWGYGNNCGEMRISGGDGNKQWMQNWRDGNNQLNAKDNFFRNSSGYGNNLFRNSLQSGNNYRRNKCGNILL